MALCTGTDNPGYCPCSSAAVDDNPDNPSVSSRKFKDLNNRLNSLTKRFTVSDSPEDVNYTKNVLHAHSLLLNDHPFIAKVLLEMHYDFVFIMSALSNLKVIDKPLNSNTMQQCQVNDFIKIIRDKLRDYDYAGRPAS